MNPAVSFIPYFVYIYTYSIFNIWTRKGVTNKRCEIKTGKCDYVFLFNCALTRWLYYSGTEVAVAVTRCEKIVFTSHITIHTRVFSFCTRFFLLFCSIFVHIYTRTRNNTAQRLFEPDKSHGEGVFFRGKKPKIKGGFAQNTGSHSRCIIQMGVRRVCINFNPALCYYDNNIAPQFTLYNYYSVCRAKTQQWLLHWVAGGRHGDFRPTDRPVRNVQYSLVPIPQ